MQETKKSDYQPSVLDTSSVELPADLMLLAEQMAENVHEVWAATRIEQGWTYGPERDDTLKHHPCLVPYGELPESEKVYDRNTSIETLKFILAKGWKITK
jgi:ryanodine receptor 2